MKAEKNKDNIWRLIFPSVLVVVVLWLANWYLLEKDVERGTFGDMFGTVNALFSGLAFAGIIITIWLQKTELALQRDELAATRQEFIEQNETLSKQRFENTFFHLVSLFNEVINNLYYTHTQLRVRGPSKTEYEKRQVFDVFFKLLRDNLNRSNFLLENDGAGGQSYKAVENLIEEEQISNLRTAYNKFYQDHMHILGHYFMSLYHIFKFIHTSNLTIKEKRFYAAIIRAQLSSTELFLIFYNALIPELGYPKFLYLSKEYDILQNFDFDLIENEIHINYYKKLVDVINDPFV